MAAPHNVRWGIMATGWIAEEFTKDLLIDSKLRDAGDISHTVAGVASSSSKARAEKFITDFKVPAPCAAYGSYKELVADPNVDIVYVATPHSHHFQNVMLALENGKNVLCEKAFTVNAAQAKILVQTAKKKNLFLMEAVWTRYFPLSIEIRNRIKNGDIGEVLRVTADTSFGEENPEGKWGTTHRMVNKDLAGGALLDLGIYSLTWVFQTLYHTLPPSSRKPPTVSTHMTPYPLTGADEATTMLLTFPHSTPSGKPNSRSHAVAMTHIRVSANPSEERPAPAIRIQGTKGEIQVEGPAFCPTTYRLIPAKQGGQEKAAPIDEKTFTFPGNGKGMYYEADEAARCLRDKKLESEGLTWEESVVIMEVMDEVRKQGGLDYPEKIESTVYPLEL